MTLILTFLVLVINSVISFKPNARLIRTSRKLSINMKLMDHFDALLFDCDGVIAETERDAHRVTFNQAFKHKGLSSEWDVELYGELLKTGGGKERMISYFNKVGWPDFVEEKEKETFVKELHAYKTDQLKSLVESGAVPLRPGVSRLIDEAFKNDIKVAVCSTSNELAVTTIVKTLLGEERLSKIQIFAGDIVKHKKPAPDIYLLAAKTLQVEPSRCWVIEDSEIGNKAAKSAGMNCLVTKSIYTADENFEMADIIIDNLDKGLDGAVTVTYLNYKASPRVYKANTLTENSDLFGGGTNVGKMFEKLANGQSGSPFGKLM